MSGLASSLLPSHRTLLSIAMSVCVLLLARPARSGDWHTAAEGDCTDCHTQHNSVGGAPGRTDNDPTPANYMLKRESIDDLCLSCHDGSNASAPDVVAPVSYVADPAGGFFSTPGNAVMTGHDVGTGAEVIPPGGTQPMTLSCATCHDPHGNTNYRNLRFDPTATNRPPAVVSVSQTVGANGSNPAQVYVRQNLVDKSGMSAWCNSCHDPTGENAQFDHPVDRSMWGSFFADYPTWSNPAMVNRTRAQSPSDDDIPSQDDQVFCLSCHKAHGNENYKSLFHADGVTSDSTCLQCHDV